MENPVTQVKTEHLAYVLFTSGSTGRPKGVAIEHRMAVNFVQWAKQVFSAAELKGVLFSTSVCFDLSIFEMFVTLSAGGTIILAPNALHLPTLPCKNDVTLINTVPSAIAELVRMGAIPPSVKTVNLAGEALPNALVEQIYATTNVSSVYNLYGPTETTTYSTYTRVPRGCPVTIGRPIANTQVYILDRNYQPVPVGIVGELFIGGDGVARGYLDRPEMTSERFISNPFDPRGDGRLYRTGDLARFRVDGRIEFLGRADNQVKLRGFRIELGEIEAVLGQHAQVQAAVVVVRQASPGDPRVMAYVVPRPGIVPTGGDLRRFLEEKLPEYMVPSAYRVVEALPLLPNGKVDRQALAALEPIPSERETAYVAPRTPVEEGLAQIWAELLHVERVGVHDDFFELGGHSLLAARVMARVCDVFQVQVPLRRLFEKPTVADLAEGIEMARGVVHGEEALPIRPVPREGPFPLSVTQMRFWLLDQLQPGSVSNLPYFFRITGPLDVAALRQSLQAVVNRHEVLRTIFPSQNGQPRQVIVPELTVAIPVIDLQNIPEGEREERARQTCAEEERRPFDLGGGPLVRALLLRLGECDHIFHLNLHHIVSDAWSMSVLKREIAVVYGAIRAGEPSPVRPLPIQYADFTVWHLKRLQGKMGEAQLAYWKRQLAGDLPVLELPTDRPRPPVQTFRGRQEPLTLSQPLCRGLAALSQREGASIFMILLAAFQLLLHRYTGADDVVVGAPVAGRDRVELEGLLGCFLNTLVLRTDLSGNPTFRELLGRVREVALGAYTHQDVPFEKLVEELRPVWDPSRTPLVQVMLNMHNFSDGEFPLPGLTVTRLPNLTIEPMYDLSLLYRESEEGITGHFEYNTDLFDRATIRRLLGHYQTLLEGIVATPDRPIGELPLLTDAERHQLLVAWNATATAYPRDACVHTLFEAQVARTPDAVALAWDGGTLTYAALNARANQLAHRLRALGVGPDTLVGVALDRSPDLIVALLGILKAGGAYCPLDPEYPPDRLAFMCQDAAPAVILTTTALGARLPATAVLLRLDAEAAALAQEATANPPCPATGDSLAYVMYTSGSTGMPKGTAIPQRGVVRLVQGTDYVHFGPDEVFLQFAPISFDASTFEIWGALLNGARLFLPPPTARPWRTWELSCGATASPRCGSRRASSTTWWITTWKISPPSPRSWPEATSSRRRTSSGPSPPASAVSSTAMGPPRTQPSPVPTPLTDPAQVNGHHPHRPTHRQHAMLRAR